MTEKVSQRKVPRKIAVSCSDRDIYDFFVCPLILSMIDTHSLVIDFSSKEESGSDNDSNNNGEKMDDNALHNLSEE